MKKRKKLLAGILASTMFFTSVPYSLQTQAANETTTETSTDTSTAENTRYKNIDVEAENVPISTMSVYKNMDYSFLQTFEFGKTYEGTVNAKIITGEKLLTSSDSRIKVGNIIQTNGFYFEGDGGGATYQITDTSATNTLALENGLFAALIPDTKIIDEKKWAIINPLQLGVKTNGSAEAQAILGQAFNIASDSVKNNEDIFRGLVYLPKGEYKCAHQLHIHVQDINIVGDGDDTVIFTDNDYADWYEFFMWSSGGQNLYLGNFKVEARERDKGNYYRQLTFVDCSNVYLYKVNMNIPQEAFSMDYYIDKQYTNLTFYAGNKNMTADSCKMELMCSTYRGANLGVLDFYCRGEENITIMNCELHSNARDEQVGMFTGVTNRDASFVKNINFINNEIYTYTPLDHSASGGHRTMCFTIAYNESRNIENIRIAGNHFHSQADSKFITFGNVDNCVIENNIIEVDCTGNNGSFVFESGNLSYGDVKIHNNEIYMTRYGKASICSGPLIFNNNRVVIDTTMMGSIIYNNGTMENNEIVAFDAKLSNLMNNSNKCIGNTVETYGGMDGFVQNSSTYDDKTITINDNVIHNYKRHFSYSHTNPFLALGKLEGGGIDNVYVTNNEYYSPNYYIVQSSSDNTQVPVGLFYCRGFSAGKITVKNNIFQQVNNFRIWDCDMTDRSEFIDNTILDYNEFKAKEDLYTEVNILNNGEKVTEIYTTEDTVNLSTNVTSGAKWYSAVDSMATVDENGTVTRKQYGDVAIYVAPTDGSYSSVYNEEGNETSQEPLYAKCIIHFQKATAEKITLQNTELTMQPGKKNDIVYEVVPSDKVSQEVLWTSSNSDVATVSEDGIITAIAPGTTTITATTKDGSNISASINVTVNPLTVKKISLNQSMWDGGELEMENGIRYSEGVAVGSTLQLNASFYPENAVNTGVSRWVSSNEEVATVDENGLVTAVGPGVADIKAYSMDDYCNANCRIYVQLEPIKNMTLDVGQNYAKLKWDAVKNVDGYRVYKYNFETGLYEQTNLGQTDNNSNQWNLTPDTGYKYMVTAYVKRRDQNGYDHYYENRATFVEFHTYKDSVLTSFRDTEKKTICVAEGETHDFTVYTAKDLYSYELEDSSIANMEVKIENNFYRFLITGVKSGETNLVFTGNDAKAYTLKIPIYVKNFGEVTLDLTGGAKKLTACWDYNGNSIDGFVITRKWIRNDTGIKLPLDEVQKVTVDGKEQYTYTIDGLSDATEYELTVKPYITKETTDFVGSGSTAKATTLEIVDIENISTEETITVEKDGKVTTQVAITPENATVKDLEFRIFDESIAEIVNVAKDGATTTLEILGKSKGNTTIDIIALDNSNLVKTLKVEVTAKDEPTLTPTTTPTLKPTDTPSSETTTTPTSKPTDTPSSELTATPSSKPTDTPSSELTATPSSKPTDTPSSELTATPSSKPTDTPSSELTITPTSEPSLTPTVQPSIVAPSTIPTDAPDQKEDTPVDVTSSVPKVTVKPTKVTSFKQVKSYTNTIKLKWKKPANATGVKIYIYKNNKWKCIATKKANVTSYTVRKLSAGKTYKFRIRSYTQNGNNTLYSSYTNLKAVTSPSKVSKVSANIKTGKLTVKWKKQNCSGYEISYSTSKKFMNAKKVTAKSSKASKKVIKKSSFKQNKTYYVRVRAYVTKGNTKYYGKYSTVKKIVIKK